LLDAPDEHEDLGVHRNGIPGEELRGKLARPSIENIVRWICPTNTRISVFYDYNDNDYVEAPPCASRVVCY
jgi:hypothetical protein